MRIGISTGGGDAPGLNAAIRGVTLASLRRGWEVIGIGKGLAGLMGEAENRPLTAADVENITHLGGTILGTTNRGDPFHWPRQRADGSWDEVDRSDELIQGAAARGLDAIITIGGDGTLAIALELSRKGLWMIGIPKTIDNDVGLTSSCLGYDTAVETATEAIDRVRSTAQSHERVMVLEVMGRHAGWIGLSSGLAGGADAILIPEIPFRIDAVCQALRDREARGRRFGIVVVAEGAVPYDGAVKLKSAAGVGTVERLGGIAEDVAAQIAERTGRESRTVTLGHLQRGGSPTWFDRMIALRFGVAATRAVAEGKKGMMVAYRPPDVITVALDAVAAASPKRVPADSDAVRTARGLGMILGD